MAIAHSPHTRRPIPRRRVDTARAVTALSAAAGLFALAGCGGPSESGAAEPVIANAPPATSDSVGTKAPAGSEAGTPSRSDDARDSGQSSRTDEPTGTSTSSRNDADTLDAVDSGGSSDVDGTVEPGRSEEGIGDGDRDESVTFEMTNELADFAEEHRELVSDWSTQLNAFGDEALDHLDDVSASPAAGPTAELSDRLIEAVGAEAADPALVTLRDFATGFSAAIGYSGDGDQSAALSVFLTLQAQADTLTAVLDLLDA